MNAPDATLPQRLSPLHDALEHLQPRWGVFHDMPVPLSIPAPETPAVAAGPSEADRARILGLVDLSALLRVTLKGPGALAVLKELDAAVPDEIFAVAHQPNGGLVARTGGAEFFIEDCVSPGIVPKIIDAAGRLEASRPGVYPVLRADASLLITGRLATELFAQTCGVDLRQASNDKLVFTRVAGVSCSILRRKFAAFDAFQLWCDGSYGLSLWESLVEIAAEQSGGPVGWSQAFPFLPPQAA